MGLGFAAWRIARLCRRVAHWGREESKTALAVVGGQAELEAVALAVRLFPARAWRRSLNPAGVHASVPAGCCLRVATIHYIGSFEVKDLHPLSGPG